MVWFLPLIFAAAGAAAGGVSTYQKGERDRKAIQHNKDLAWKQYMYGQEHSDRQFDLQRNQALEHLTVQQKNLDTQIDLSVDQFNTGLLEQAYSIQDAQIQNESGIGMSFAYEAASGTRGNAANQLMRDYASQGLDRHVEIQDRQNKSYLNLMVAGANQSADAISSERASWMPGGYRLQAKAAQDEYNRNVANLGQFDFDWKMAAAKPTALDYATTLIGGGSSGYSMGTSVTEHADDWWGKFKFGEKL